MKMTPKSNYTTATYDALVDLAHSLRPGWDQAGIRQAIRTALIRQPMPTLADLAYALVRLAIDPTIVTPSVLGMDGPHWHTTTVQHTAPQPPRRCRNCGNEITYAEAHTCIAPRIGDFEAGRHAVRNALAEARAHLCPHGTLWRDSHQHNDHVIAGEVINSEETP
jgi:hypothetical protein